MVFCTRRGRVGAVGLASRRLTRGGAATRRPVRRAWQPSRVGPSPLHYAAFTTVPAGGNPAGVVLDAGAMPDAEMLALAAQLGYSESAFLRPATSPALRRALLQPRGRGAVLRPCHDRVRRRAGRPGGRRPLVLTRQRRGPVDIATGEDGTVATLTSVPPYVEEPDPALVDRRTRALRWDPGDLDPDLPAAGGVRRRAPPDPRRPDPRAPGRPGLRLRRAEAADAGARPDHVALVWREYPPRSTRATRSRSAAWSRTRPPAPPRPRSAPTCANSGRSTPR